MKKWMLALGIISFYSCEKNIDFNLQESEPVLTVDAQVENGMAPLVVLTKVFLIIKK